MKSFSIVRGIIGGQANASRLRETGWARTVYIRVTYTERKYGHEIRFNFLKTFLLCTIFKVCIEFATMSLLFYVLEFLATRHVGSYLHTKDLTCTPCPGRPNLIHQGSTSDLNLSGCVKNLLGQKSIAWRSEKNVSKILQKMCARHKPGLAELQTFSIFFLFFSMFPIFFSIYFYFFFLITKIFQLFIMDLIKKIREHSPQGLPRMITLICLHIFFRYYYISWCNSL